MAKCQAFGLFFVQFKCKTKPSYYSFDMKLFHWCLVAVMIEALEGRSITGLYIIDPPGPNANSSIHQLIRLLLDSGAEGQNILKHMYFFRILNNISVKYLHVFLQKVRKVFVLEMEV